MNELLKFLAKHKVLTVITCVVVLIKSPPTMIGILFIVWLVKFLRDFEGGKK